MNIHFKDGKPFGYLEPKPKEIETDNEYWWKQHDIDLKFWQSTCIAIKEPEFGEEETIYESKTGKQWVVFDIILATNQIECFELNPNRIGRRYKKFKKSDLSHYYEGQEIDRDKFRLVKKAKQMFEDKEVVILGGGKWQEVKEPNANDIEYYYNHHWNLKKFEKDLAKFQEDKKKGLIVLEQFKF